MSSQAAEAPDTERGDKAAVNSGDRASGASYSADVRYIYIERERERER